MTSEDWLNKIRQQLKSPDMMTRHRAIKHLADNPTPAAIPLLIQALDDYDWFLVGRPAAEALAGIGQPAIQSLLNVLNAPPGLGTFPESGHEQAAYALGLIADPATASALLSALQKTAFRRVWWTLVWAMGRLGIAHIEPHLAQVENPAIHARLSRALQLVGGDEKSTLPALIDILNNNDETLWRIGAAILSGKMGHSQALPSLITIVEQIHQIDLSLLGGESQQLAAELASTAIRALDEIGDRQAVPGLIRLVEDESVDDYFRLDAMSTLGHLGDSRAVRPLLNIMENEQVNISLPPLVSDWLVLIGEDAVEILLAYARNPANHHFPRVLAIEALARIGPPAVHAGLPEVLGELLRDDQHRVQRAAQDALDTLHQSPDSEC
jgi:HEAT repeat protein